MTNVSVFGLGKVGHTLACCLAVAGNRVVGYDPLAGLVRAINDRAFRSPEPGVAERLSAIGPKQLRATTSPVEAVFETDVTMLIVPTPSNASGGFSLKFVLDAIEHIGEALRQKTRPHVVAVVSTVLPGASDRFIVPALERAAGRTLGDGIGYCYNPSFIALGEVVKGLEQPSYILIGESDKAAGDVIETIHRSMLKSETPVSRMRPIEAEITKIASNTYETTRVAFANMLFAICSEVPEADVDKVTGALAHRVGRRFFRGAVPYGGPCWPRDNRAFASFMDLISVPSLLPKTIDVSNSEHGRYLLRKILQATDSDQTIGLLGLSYKPGTHVTESSFGLDLARWLTDEGRHVVAWDPLAMPEARVALGDSISYASSPEACLRACNAAVIINPMPELNDVDWSAASSVTVMDPWRCIPAAAIEKLGRYVAMGRSSAISMQDWLSNDDERLRALNS